MNWTSDKAIVYAMGAGSTVAIACAALALWCGGYAKKASEPEVTIRVESVPFGYTVTRVRQRVSVATLPFGHAVIQDRKISHVSNADELEMALEPHFDGQPIVIEVRDDQGFKEAYDAVSAAAGAGYFPWNIKNLDHPTDEFAYRGSFEGGCCCCGSYDWVIPKSGESDIYQNGEAFTLYLNFSRNSEWVDEGQINQAEIGQWLDSQPPWSIVGVYCDLTEDTQVKDWWPLMKLVKAKGFRFVMDLGDPDTDFSPETRKPASINRLKAPSLRKRPEGCCGPSHLYFEDL